MHTHAHVWMVGNVNGWSSSVFGLGFDSQYASTTGPKVATVDHPITNLGNLCGYVETEAFSVSMGV